MFRNPRPLDLTTTPHRLTKNFVLLLLDPSRRDGGAGRGSMFMLVVLSSCQLHVSNMWKVLFFVTFSKLFYPTCFSSPYFSFPPGSLPCYHTCKNSRLFLLPSEPRRMGAPSGETRSNCKCLTLGSGGFWIWWRDGGGEREPASYPVRVSARVLTNARSEKKIGQKLKCTMFFVPMLAFLDMVINRITLKSTVESLRCFPTHSLGPIPVQPPTQNPTSLLFPSERMSKCGSG